MLKLSGIMLAVSMALWPLLSTTALLLLFGCTFGFFAGSFVTVLPAVLSQVFGPERIASVTGIIYCGFALGDLIGSPITGWFYDEFGSYTWGIWLASAVMFVSFVFMYLVQVPANNNTTDLKT
eukprot:TRINITY_DN2755_c1_g2_i1.p2 TRINITY_DN2755_c1_g2~~TRINITY_DN2755_c1_g2_i1.p2  ORF type:complete len:123 (+),score=28.91 TRINITY_DN2755_c1_g2_i1:1136-1504(+)